MTSPEATVLPAGQAVLPHKESIDGHRYRIDKRKRTPPEMAGQSTSRAEQAWKQVLAGDALQNYHCPRCKTGIVRYQRVRGNLCPVAQCDNDRCSWTVGQMTSEERAELARVDPDALRIADHAAKITGKERRMKKFLNRCACGWS